MSVTGDRLARAEARSKAAKTRLGSTIAEIRCRLKPTTIVRNVTAQVKEAGADLAQSGVDTVRRNPGKVAGALTLIGLVLARHPIVRRFNRHDEKDATAGETASLKRERVKAPRTRK